MAGLGAVWQRHCMPLMDEEATRFDRFDWLQNVLDFMLGPGVAGWLIETGGRATEQDAAFFPLDKVQSNLRAFFVILAYIVALGGGAIWLIQRKDIAGFRGEGRPTPRSKAIDSMIRAGGALTGLAAAWMWLMSERASEAGVPSVLPVVPRGV